MSAVAIFAAAFLLLVAITFVVPVLPPAQLLYEFLKIPQPTLFIWGISVATLFNGVTNGFFWGIVAAAVYGLSRHFTRRKPLPPMPVARDLPTTPPKPMPLDYRADRYPPAITVRKKRGLTERDIETIEGIGPLRGRMLRNARIRTVDDLLRAGATRRGRQRLANEFGVSYATMHRWVYRGDLLRVRGIGRQYSELLETAGVTTVTDLSTRNPRYLWQTLKVVNRERKLVRRIPPHKTIEIWVNKAKNLEPIVE
jgi:predicted flap endonuclease-1-like 5' DNA nuclease